MSKPTKTSALLASAHAVASVSSGAVARPYANRTASSLVNKSAIAGLFVALAMALPSVGHAQTYRPANQYSAAMQQPVVAVVVGVSNYSDNSADQYERRQQSRNAAAARQAKQRTASLVGSLVSAVAGDMMGGSSNRYARQASNIGRSFAGQTASNMVRNSGSRVNTDDWNGNMRVMSQQMTKVTLDVRYPNNMVERIQIRQSAAMSQGLSRGDQVTLHVTTDPRTGQQIHVAVETPQSRARSTRVRR